MATRLFSDLVNRVAPSVPGCPQPVILTYIRNAAIDVCERTNAWRYKHAAVTMTAGTYEYAFVPESNAEVYSVLTANINGNELTPITLEALHQLYPKYPSAVTTERATPQYFFQVSPITFHVALVPVNSTDKINMFVAQRPSRASTGMNEAVMDDVEDAIMHGALQQLLTLPERTWSDTELAAYHAKQFVFKVTERRARVNIGVGRAAPTVRQSAWA
tara:strand:- start:1398 stop:2048 length:651 start_codon:yes stop_codon:yes gene_type:complete